MFAILPDFDGQTETFFQVNSWATEALPRFSADQLRAEGVTSARWWSPDELLSTDRDPMRFAGSDHSGRAYHRQVDVDAPGMARATRGRGELDADARRGGGLTHNP